MHAPARTRAHAPTPARTGFAWLNARLRFAWLNTSSSLGHAGAERQSMSSPTVKLMMFNPLKMSWADGTPNELRQFLRRMKNWFRAEKRHASYTMRRRYHRRNGRTLPRSHWVPRKQWAPRMGA